MKKEKTTKSLVSETSFLKQLFTNKWFLAGIGGLLIFVILSLIFIYNPKFVPEEIKGANKDVIDKVIGKDLSAKIDETRDENGATTIRTLFNLNKEENEEEHCEDKEEREQDQDRCENPVDDEKDNEGKKTYKNDEFGYSVKVPSNWEKRADKTIFVDQSLINSEGEVSDIEVEVYDNKNNLGINDWINANKNIFIGDQEINEVAGFNNRTQISIGRLSALQFIWESMGEIKTTIIAHNSKIYVINISTLSSFTLDADMEKIGDEFIKSFKIND